MDAVTPSAFSSGAVGPEVRSGDGGVDEAVDTGIDLGVWRIDQAAQNRLRQMAPRVMGGLDPILDEFYTVMGRHPKLVPLLAESGKVDCLKLLQKEHWREFFSAEFDDAYRQRVIATGEAHNRVGLDAGYYLSGYSLVLERLIKGVIERNRWRPQAAIDETGALVRAVMMEISLVLSVYYRARSADETLSNMQELAELFELELDNAVEFVRRGAKEMEMAAERVLGAAKQVSQDSQHAASASQEANDSAQAIASAAERLSTTISHLSGQVNHSNTAASNAAAQSRDARQQATRLEDVSQRIGSIVQLIERIAKETRLLALNANIEAARVGELGRGFAVVASEVKSLADQTNSATDDIRTEIHQMQAVIRRTAETIAEVADLVDVVTGDIGGIAESIGEQAGVTNAIADSAGGTAGSIDSVHNRILSVSQEADASTHEATNLRDYSRGMVDQVLGIKRRVIATLRGTRFGNRRGEERVAVDIAVKVSMMGKEVDAQLDNLSFGGAQVRQPSLAAGDPKMGTPLTIDIPRLGQFRGRLVSSERDVLHVAFEEVTGSIATRLQDLLDRYRREDDELIALAKDTAQRVGQALEAALERHEIGWDDLWDSDYRLVVGSDPPQFTTRFTVLCDRILPPIQEPLLKRNSRITFTAAIDRNGYLPTHNAVYSQPQRPGQREWNTANCRNRRIFDDRTGLAAARSRQPVLVQTYRRDMGGGSLVAMKDISAPVMVNGQHWGGFRIGCRSQT